MFNNIKFLLLDLDGTLLSFDLNTFISEYLRLAQQHFSHILTAKSVPEWIMAGTNIMLTSVETITNKDKFVRCFQSKSGMSEEEIWEIFVHFYQTDYDRLQSITVPVPGAKTFVELAQAKGYRLVIATQPVFPEIAIRKRLAWSGLNRIDYELITHIENMSACKPHRQYFDQILGILKTNSDCCLMIGNDREMDMAAGKVGIPTYYLQPAPSNVKIDQADFQGDFTYLSELLGILQPTDDKSKRL